MDSLVALNGIGVSLGGKQILRALDVKLQPGEILGVSGPNGSGKTTLVRLLATLLRPDKGSGVVLEAELGSNDIYRARRSIGLIGHTPALIDELSLRENLIHFARLGGPDAEQVDQVLSVVGLEDAGGRLTSASSFGMKRRIEVAYLLMTRPSLVLLDEATSGLDSAAQGLVAALLERTINLGGGALMVSHDADSLESVCGRLLRIHDGRLESTQ